MMIASGPMSLTAAMSAGSGTAPSLTSAAASCLKLDRGLVQHRFGQIEGLHVGNLGQAGEHEALLIGAESRGQDRLQGLNLVFGGERDGFLLRRQPHTGANSQGAEVLFRRPTGD